MEFTKPPNAILYTSPLGREFYLSGIDGDTYIIRFMDNGEIKRVSERQYKEAVKK